MSIRRSYRKAMLLTGASGGYRVVESDSYSDGASGSNVIMTRSAGGVYQYDHDGVLRFAKDNEFPFVNARRVENLVDAAAYSSFVTGGAAGSTVPTVANTTYLSQPCFGITYASGVTGFGVSRYSAQHISGISTALKYAGRLAVAFSRALTGSEEIRIKLYSSTSNFVGTVLVTASHAANSTSWTALGGAAIVAGTTIGTLDIWSAGAALSSAVTVYISRINLVNKTGATNTASEEDVSVGVLAAPYHGAGVDGVKYFASQNGITVNGTTFILTEAAGSALTSVRMSVEGTGANLIAAANYRDFATWTKVGLTMKATTPVLVDGTTAASALNEILEDALTSEHSAAITWTAATAAKQSVMIAVKRGTGTKHIQLRIHNATDLFYGIVTYNLDTLALIGTLTGGYSTAYVKGAYTIIELVSTNTTTGAQNLYVNIHNGTGISYAGSGVDTLILDWAQVVTSGIAQSPVQGATTRNASFFSRPWIGATINFWVYVDFYLLYSSQAIGSNNFYPFAIRKDASNLFQARILFSAGDIMRISSTNGGVAQTTDAASFSVDKGDRVRIVASFDSVNGARFRAVNQSTVFTGSVATSVAPIAGLASGATLYLGSEDGATAAGVNTAEYITYKLGTGILTQAQQIELVGA